MISTVLPQHSLKTRITLATLTIFVLSLWSLAIYASRMLREDMQNLLGEQQLSVAAFMASQVNQELDDRFKLLDKVSKIVGPAILGDAKTLQTMLENRPALREYFNGGYIAYGPDGTALAEMPLTAGRVGMNDMDTATVAAALKEGKSTIGSPVMDKKTHQPSMAMTVPIRNTQGEVIGALGGVIYLKKPNFLGVITENRHGKRGDYFLAAPKDRLILAASDESRIMEALPAPGVNAMLDRFAQGFEGTELALNPMGLEVMSSAKRIALAGWYVGATQPTKESFASVKLMQFHLLLATIFLTLLAGALTWWTLRRQLAPLLTAARTLATLSQSTLPPQPLAIARPDEIGQLIGGFNLLLNTLAQREVALLSSELHLRRIFETEPECIKIVDAQGRLVQMNPAGLSLIEADSPEQVVGMPVLDLIAPEYRQSFSDMHQRVLAGESMQIEFEVLGLKGGRRWLETHAVPLPLDGKVAQLAVSRDITERKLAETELRIAATAFESQQGMFITNAEFSILRVNQAFTKITGYSAQEVLDQNPRLLSSGRHDAAYYELMWRCIGQTGTWSGEVWNRRKNGEIYPEWLTITAVKDGAGRACNYVATFSDITSRKASEGKIQNLAFYDPLTDLPNRRLLMDRLAQALSSSVRHLRKGALLLVDLDDFKSVNETLGHGKGDLLLLQVAQRLTACIHDGDTVARLAGDEFVVLLEDLSKNKLEAASQTEAMGEKIRLSLNQSYWLNGEEHHITPSIGATLFGDQQEAIDEPLKRVDIALNKAKSAGRNSLLFFDPQMQAAVTARAALEAGLREALAHEQFLLHYQAQVTGNDQLIGVEALVRWQHPQRGMVSPAEFIPLAEETGLIFPLGLWVLETACTQLTRWAVRVEMAHLTMAVNVSARQFQQSDFVDQVLAVLARTGAKPQRLKLELTESVLVSSLEDVVAKMTALKEVGVCFSLDDFGTGYSSLSYLSQLPLDQLKIDQSFVMNIEHNDSAAAICATTISLAHGLKLKVVAEGVETEAQRYFLSTVHRCDYMQGYLFSRPLPLQELEAFAARM